MSAELEQARQIAVALEQENARLRELADTLAGRWAEVAKGIRAVGEADPHSPLGRLRLERARILRGAARDLRWLLANDTIPHWLMTTAELGEEDAS